MKKLILCLTLILSVFLIAACADDAQPAADPAQPADDVTQPADDPAQPADVPEAGTRTITWSTIAGFYTDWAEEVARVFTADTGIEIDIVQMDLPTMYERQVLDIVAGTGHFDIITWNVSWKGEWANAGFMLPLTDFIARDADEVDIDDFAQSVLQVSGVWQGEVFGLPYYTFTPGFFYRVDLFEDEGERAAFREQFGYELDIPETYEQMSDIAQFFTRSAGELLKGEPLEQNMFGIGLQAGRFNNIFDEINTIAWTFGGDVLRDDGSSAVLDEPFVRAVEMYVYGLIPYAPPGSLSGSFDFVISQLNNGIIAMTGPMYLDQWANAVLTEDLIPGAEVNVAGLPGGGKTWAGAFTLGIASSTEDPEAAWEFLKFITGKEAQRMFAEGGGTTTRTSILNDTAFYSARREAVGHFPVLNQILEHSAANWYTNFIWAVEAANIYEEAPMWLSAAASGEMSVMEALEGLNNAINEFTGGNATIHNEGVHRPTTTEPWVFDRSVQLRP